MQKTCSRDCFHCEYGDCIMDHVKNTEWEAERIKEINAYVFSQDDEWKKEQNRDYYRKNREKILARLKANRQRKKAKLNEQVNQ